MFLRRGGAVASRVLCVYTCRGEGLCHVTCRLPAQRWGAQAVPLTSSVRQSHYDNLVSRDLYNELPFLRSAKARIQEVGVTPDGKNASVAWDDGTSARYHSMWLRQSCHCSDCRLSTNQPVVNFEHVDLDATLVTAEKEGDHLLKVTWSDDDKHTGLFPLPFLKHFTYTDEALLRKRQERKMVFSTEGKIPEVDYTAVMDTEQGLYSWLRALNDHGICLVKNVPTEEGQVKKVAERIAPVQSSIYGETFDVKDKPNPTNFAYTPVRLELHMDQPMYESPPGLQLLHCIRFDKEVPGGDSFFVDLFQVAETFREKHPREFQDLVRIPATFDTTHYQRDIPVQMTYLRPHITLNHLDEIVGVTWHPGLVGPLQAKEEDVEPYYRAFKLLNVMVNNFPVQYRIRLEAGDLISFNNRRVLHGRDKYNPNRGHRFLQGTYVQIDEYRSQVQVYLNKMGGGKLATRVGNMDWQ